MTRPKLHLLLFFNIALATATLAFALHAGVSLEGGGREIGLLLQVEPLVLVHGDSPGPLIEFEMLSDNSRVCPQRLQQNVNFHLFG